MNELLLPDWTTKGTELRTKGYGDRLTPASRWAPTQSLVHFPPSGMVERIIRIKERKHMDQDKTSVIGKRGCVHKWSKVRNLFPVSRQVFTTGWQTPSPWNVPPSASFPSALIAEHDPMWKHPFGQLGASVLHVSQLLEHAQPGHCKAGQQRIWLYLKHSEHLWHVQMLQVFWNTLVEFLRFLVEKPIV